MQRKILDFFTKTSNVKNSKQPIDNNTNGESTKEDKHDDESDVLDIKPKIFKRSRFASDDDQSDEENHEHLTSKNTVKKMRSIDQDLENVIKTSPIIQKKKVSKVITPSTKTFLSSFQLKQDVSFSEPKEFQTAAEPDTTDKEGFLHFSFQFLKKESIMDASRHRPDHPDYDVSTLYVPADFLSGVTPGMLQWWKLKINGMNDTLLFFKVGKFYELYHMDAVIAANELGISFMKGGYAHCGFPETTFTKMSDQLVQKGYKVARVEQTETVDDLNNRNQSGSSKEKVVRREICQIVTPGTRTFSLRNSSTRTLSQVDGEDITFDDNVGAMLYSIKESPIDDAPRNKSRLVVEIGVAVLNANTGKFMLAQFDDDNQRSKFRTMLSRYVPNEIIYQKNNLSKDTQNLLNSTLAAVHKESLFKHKQFLSADDTLKCLLEGGYFIDTPKNKLSTFGLPIGLSEVLNDGDNLGRTAATQFQLAVSSLGGLMYYLQKCLIDKYMVSMADFVVYHPTDQYQPQISSAPFYTVQSNMILDSNTLHNLDLLRNSVTGGVDGTLLERLDFTLTPFGKRLLLQCIATPLCHPHAIIERQNAVAELIELEPRLGPIRQKLKTLPDLEKSIARIHVIGLTKSVADHPDARAVLYENLQYSRRKINDFIVTISAFNTIVALQAHFCDLNFEGKIRSSLLRRLTLCQQDHETGLFPELDKTVAYFQEAFDHDQAKKDGKITPEQGIDQDYDDAVNGIKELEKELASYLKKQGALFGCKINYFGTAKNRYQLEIPESKCDHIPRTYNASSQRKGFKRYETLETQRLLAEMIRAEEKRDVAMKNIMNRIFAKFDEFHVLWTGAIDCLSQLDVLLAMSCFSKGVDGGPMTRPDIKEVTPSTEPFLVITEGRYACKAKTQSGEFISNTIRLGNETGSSTDHRVMLLTGPNMGGKSTLMRQTALIVVLSQLGCYVPAEGPVILTPVDRLLTRQGANDAIGSGQSTLQVELNETASILTYMTAHSFLLVDELGRGTATHDGCALACSIMNSIVDKCEPRTIFSTHFHKLLEEKSLVDKLQLCHMACMVEDDIDDMTSDKTETELQNITFLYKLQSGGCPKSYGFNAARLANIPAKIILNGLNKARLFEEETLILEFKQLLVAVKTGNELNKEQLKVWQNKFKKLYML